MQHLEEAKAEGVEREDGGGAEGESGEVGDAGEVEEDLKGGKLFVLEKSVKENHEEDESRADDDEQPVIGRVSAWNAAAAPSAHVCTYVGVRRTIDRE